MNDNKELTEKQRIEKATGKQFLELYNKKFNTSYSIVEFSDAPDVICKDKKTEKQLFLEITLLEDLPGDVAYASVNLVNPFPQLQALQSYLFMMTH